MEYKDVYTLKINDKDHLISAQEATQLSSAFIQAEKEQYIQEFFNPLIKEDLIESIFYKTISIPTTLTERSLQKLYVVYDILESLKILFNML